METYLLRSVILPLTFFLIRLSAQHPARRLVGQIRQASLHPLTVKMWLNRMLDMSHQWITEASRLSCDPRTQPLCTGWWLQDSRKCQLDTSVKILHNPWGCSINEWLLSVSEFNRFSLRLHLSTACAKTQLLCADYKGQIATSCLIWNQLVERKWNHLIHTWWNENCVSAWKPRLLIRLKFAILSTHTVIVTGRIRQLRIIFTVWVNHRVSL